MYRPRKIPDAEIRIARCVANNDVLLSKHAVMRMNEPQISFREIILVLREGRRERAKDEWHLGMQAWGYAYRARAETRDLRVAVALDETSAVVITAIELGVE